MTALHFTESAKPLTDVLTRIATLLDRIDEVLDLLEANPGDARVRQRRFAKIGAWGVVVRDRHDDWLILWEPHPRDPSDVTVTFIGPDRFF